MTPLKTSAFATSLNSLQPFQCRICLATQASSSTSPRTRPSRRTYAQVHDRSKTSSSSSWAYTWPEPIPPQRTPTPYQILRHNPHDAYSKSTFHALVKLYHPDRTQHLSTASDPSLSSTPRPVLLERYRLIVAAHAILSDPVKRSMYDRFGAGWASHARGPGASSTASESPWWYPFDLPSSSSSKTNSHHRSWRPGHDPMANATWEDWEKWHSRDNPDRTPQHPIFMSNGAFISFLLCFVAVGAAVQSSRADAFREQMNELRDKVNAESRSELRRVQDAGRQAVDQEDSIRLFLENREADRWAREDEEDVYRRYLPRGEKAVGKAE